MTDNFNKARIVKNSILLYIRMLFTMWLNLYATRLVLKNLGVDDMGVYGVVGSVVGLFAVFSSVFDMMVVTTVLLTSSPFCFRALPRM